MKHYFSHAFKNRQWVVTFRGRFSWLYYRHNNGSTLDWRKALVMTRQGANKVAKRLRLRGHIVRIKYQSIPSTRNMYR